MSKLCTGEAGYSSVAAQDAVQTVTPAAPADISMFEIYGFDHENLPEDSDADIWRNGG